MAEKVIAVLSGKGGTGKTLLSVNLACLIKDSSYVDCDVEEPNGHLFLKPTEITKKDVGIFIPSVDFAKCNGCMKCVEFCRFNALAYVGKIMIFKDICHFCGGCTLVCPEKAIKEVNRNIGKIERGKSEDVTVLTGFLNVGRVSGVPIIEEMQREIENLSGVVFVDCPPGSACAVMEAVQASDYCILVAEPTTFGAHNLDMVYRLVTLFNKPCGVVLNKCDDNENPSKEYCIQNKIEILSSIPYDKELSLINGNGDILVRVSDKYRKLFQNILDKVKGAAGL